MASMSASLAIEASLEMKASRPTSPFPREASLDFVVTVEQVGRENTNARRIRRSARCSVRWGHGWCPDIEDRHAEGHGAAASFDLAAILRHTVRIKVSGGSIGTMKWKNRFGWVRFLWRTPAAGDAPESAARSSAGPVVGRLWVVGNAPVGGHPEQVQGLVAEVVVRFGGANEFGETVTSATAYSPLGSRLPTEARRSSPRISAPVARRSDTSLGDRRLLLTRSNTNARCRSRPR